MSSPYRADHVGSLLRPASLLEQRAAHAAGQLSLEALRTAEDRAILDALALQRELGLDVYSDGELRRSSWQSDLAEAVEGFVPEHITRNWKGPGGGAEPSRALVAGAPLRQTRRITGHESGFLREHSPGPCKMTMPSPSVFALASFRTGITDQFYPTRADLLAALVPMVREEIRALIAEGVSYIQLDAPQYTYFGDDAVRAQWQRDGLDPDDALRQIIAGDRATGEGLAQEGVTPQGPTAAQRGPTPQGPTAAQRGPTLALHLCRGNNRSRWVAEGGYDRIAEQLFAELPFERFLLEYDSPRAGSFEPLRFVPPGKMVVLGLVTTKEARLESSDELRRRIDEAARYVPLEQLALSPQCGFASVEVGNLLTPDDQRRKLELIVETARKVWG